MPAKRVTDLPSDVLDAAQRVWFAGLGALALAQEQSANAVDGTAKLFTMLVEKGQDMGKDGLKTLKAATKPVGAVDEAWGKVQKVIDAQVTFALHRIGVPTHDEIAKLSDRIEQLTASIEALKARA